MSAQCRDDSTSNMKPGAPRSTVDSARGLLRFGFNPNFLCCTAVLCVL